MGDGIALPSTDAGFVAAATRALVRLVTDVAGARDAVLCSVDGFAVASAHPGEAQARLAAMTSSMLALSRAVLRELALGDIDVLVLEGAEGRVLMVAVPVAPRPLLLMLACSRADVTGQALWRARRCVAEITGSVADPV